MKVLKNLAVSSALIATLAIPASVFAQPVPAAPYAAAKDKDDKGKREQHPAIRAAIRALERAKDDMQKANHDFGGHRVSALKACDEAIEQLKQALNYDKK